jgi:hypothetical protein
MSVIITLRLKGDPRRLEEYAAANQDAMRGIADKAQQHGLIAHRFYGSEEGDIMVADEWPDPASFQSFFDEARSDIDPMMRAAGVSDDPELKIWRKLETHDEVGWQMEQRFDRSAAPRA